MEMLKNWRANFWARTFEEEKLSFYLNIPESTPAKNLSRKNCQGKLARVNAMGGARNFPTEGLELPTGGLK